jgi:hypothetical protein
VLWSAAKRLVEAADLDHQDVCLCLCAPQMAQVYYAIGKDPYDVIGLSKLARPFTGAIVQRDLPLPGRNCARSRSPWCSHVIVGTLIGEQPPVPSAPSSEREPVSARGDLTSEPQKQDGSFQRINCVLASIADCVRTGTVAIFRDALEVEIINFVVNVAYCEHNSARRGRPPGRHYPRCQHITHLKPQIQMRPGRVVLMDDISA